MTRAALALAVLALGCGGRSTMDIELFYLGDCECDFFDVDLSGGVTAGLLFYLDEDFEPDAGGCRDLAPSTDNDLEEVAALLAEIPVEPLRASTILYVEAIVYSPPIAASECGTEAVDSRIILYGADENVPLRGGDTTLFLDMSCESLPASLCL